jgi:CubicO group peptidase (beta-lactamase class C family)
VAVPRDEIDAIFAEWDRDDSPGCALAVVQDGAVIYSRGYGMSNLEHGVPIEPNSIFHVASISKQFTALCIAMLASEGLLSLDDDIRVHVPEIPDYGNTITVRHLIHHTSGLRDMWDLLRLVGWRYDDLITEGDMLWVASRQAAPNFRPGDEYVYSNTGYALLALIIRRVSGKSLREFADERIFKPLGMSRTHVHDDHTEIVRGRTQAYEPRKGGGLRISIPVFDVAGTTSLFTTVEDITRWDDNFTHRRVGGDAVFEQTLMPGKLNDGGPMSYAFGLQVHAYRGLPIVEHSGADAGYRAHYLRIPDERFAVVCLCNLSTMTPRTLALSVADLMLAERFTESLDNAVAGPSSVDGRLAGVYRNTATGDLLKITSDEQGLTIGFDDGQRLEQLADGAYQVAGQTLTRLRFEERDGVICLINGALYSPTPDPVFVRIEEQERIATQSFDGGIFHSDEVDATYALKPDGEKLLMKHHRLDDRTLYHAYGDTYAANNFRIELDRDEAGAVVGFRASTFRVRNFAFVRS